MAERLKQFLERVKGMLSLSPSTRQAVLLWALHGKSMLRARAQVAEDVWRKEWFGYCLIAIAAVLGVLFLWSVPPAGYAVTAMAVIAAIMALRPEMHGLEKFLWLFVLFIYMRVEIRAINHDQFDRNEKFEKIAKGLQKTIENGTEAVKLSQRQFEATINEVRENLRTVTGGDSFCYLGFAGLSETDANVVVISQGKYPLYGVSVRIVDARYIGNTKDVTGATLGEKHIGDMGSPVAAGLGSVQFKVAGDKQDLNVFFHGRNGFWEELIRIRKVKGKWVTATVVSGTLDVQRFPNGARLLQDVQKDFPVRELESDSDWKNTEKLPKAF